MRFFKIFGATAALALSSGLAACIVPTPPLQLDVRSSRSFRGTHQCAIEFLVENGYEITDVSAADGWIESQRFAEEEISYYWGSWDQIRAVVFVRSDESIGLQVVASSRTGRDSTAGPPSERVKGVARDLSRSCS